MPNSPWCGPNSNSVRPVTTLPVLNRGWPCTTPGQKQKPKSSTENKNCRAMLRRSWILGGGHCALAARMAAFAGDFSCVFRRFAIRTAILAAFGCSASTKFVSAFFVLVVSHEILLLLFLMRHRFARFRLLNSVHVQLALWIRRAG